MIILILWNVDKKFKKGKKFGTKKVLVKNGKTIKKVLKNLNQRRFTLYVLELIRLLMERKNSDYGQRIKRLKLNNL